IVNTDASVRIGRDALRRLVAQFADPTVGVASGRDVSVTRVDGDANLGESGYVGYEMWLRELETRVDGIVGASGCLYAIRADLHDYHLPDALSRDFAAALVARQHGYRSVTVNDALCFVPRAPSLRRESTRKVRTITRGMQTLFFKRALLNPFRYGLFSWMLFSHKVCRGLVPWALVVLVLGIAALGIAEPWARAVALLIFLGGALALAGWFWPEGRRIPRPLAIPAYIAVANLAVLRAWLKAVRGELNPIWEPTRRGPVGSHGEKRSPAPTAGAGDRRSRRSGRGATDVAALPRALAEDHHRERPQHDLQVVPHRPLLDVLEVELDLLLDVVDRLVV